jgi:hypothetical protein
MSTYLRGTIHPGGGKGDADYMTPAAKRDAEQLLRHVPPDTRGRTARLMGDPRPGRSALDQRGSGA